MFKWGAALLGYFFMRFPGAIIGFIVGSIIDLASTKNLKPGNFTKTKYKVSPADFELNLLSLCALVIKADGTTNKKELQYVRQYFISTYGEERAQAIFKKFNEIREKRQIDVRRISIYLSLRTRYEVRLQLIHFLFGIAHSDGRVTAAEAELIKTVAEHFKIRLKDFNSIRAMFVKPANSAYEILQIQKTATVSEIKKAYRTMVKKYHPDKVQSKNEAIVKGAEEKFKEVQRAYEEIREKRKF